MRRDSACMYEKYSEETIQCWNLAALHVYLEFQYLSISNAPTFGLWHPPQILQNYIIRRVDFSLLILVLVH